MARSFSTTLQYPSPNAFAAGLRVKDDTGDDFEAIADHTNRLYAAGRCHGVYQQYWSDADTNTWSVSGTAYPATPEIVIVIPKLSDRHTVVRVLVRAHKTDGAADNGTVRFVSKNGGDTEEVTIDQNGAQWYPTGATSRLDVDWDGDDKEEITIDAKIAAGANMVITSVKVEYQALTSPLAVPASTDPFVATDSTEVDADSPLAADIGRQWIANLNEIKPRHRVYMSWSRLAGVTADSISMADIMAHYYRVWTPVNPGASTDTALALTMWVYGGNVGGADTLRVGTGTGSVRDDFDEVVPDDNYDDAAIAAAVQWHGPFTLTMSERNALPQSPYTFGHFDISGVDAPPDIWAVCIWGP